VVDIPVGEPHIQCHSEQREESRLRRLRFLTTFEMAVCGTGVLQANNAVYDTLSSISNVHLIRRTP